MDIVEHGRDSVEGDSGPDGAALRAAWLDIMIQWERDLGRARGEMQPLYGVRTSMNTKAQPQPTPRRVPVALAPAA